jgi:hypothetical protein
MKVRRHAFPSIMNVESSSTPSFPTAQLLLDTDVYSFFFGTEGVPDSDLVTNPKAQSMHVNSVKVCTPF